MNLFCFAFGSGQVFIFSHGGFGGVGSVAHFSETPIPKVLET